MNNFFDEKMTKYDFLCVGAGLYGSVFAREMADRGKKVLVIDRRNHYAGNVYTDNVKGINVHRYGAHIFHTDKKAVWEYVNRFADFNGFINSPIANYKGELYSLPFNMNTFNQMWGVKTPEEAKMKLEEERNKGIEMLARERGVSVKKFIPQNLKEQAISLVGEEIYEKLIKGYTEKQWGRNCDKLPAFIIKRIPIRLTYNNSYFDSKYYGIPIGGYTAMVEKLLEGIEVKLQADYLKNKVGYDSIAEKVIYTGSIDEYFGFRFGHLEYRTLRFETEYMAVPDYQGNAVVNFTDRATPYTRIIEHKWFEYGLDSEGNSIPHTIISREYSKEWQEHDEPFYPVNDEKNNSLYTKYRELADKESNVLFGGRLGEYRYYNMDEVIESALNAAAGIS